MRKKEWIIAGTCFLIAVTGIAFALANEGALHQHRGVTQEDYEKVVGTLAPKESIFDENGDLTKEAEEKYSENVVKKKSEMLFKVKNIKNEKEMPQVKVLPADIQQKKVTKDGAKQLLEDLMLKYGVKKKYDVQYITGRESRDQMPTSEENPCYYMIHDINYTDVNKKKNKRTNIFMCKECDDGVRLPEGDFTKEKALQANLGYAFTGEEYLKPVWGFYGTKDGEPIIFLIDAVTGELLDTPSVSAL